MFRVLTQVGAIQMSTHNTCLYKEVDKKYTGCNLKTTELLDCALIGVCAVIRSNTVVPKIWSYGRMLNEKVNMYICGICRQCRAETPAFFCLARPII